MPNMLREALQHDDAPMPPQINLRRLRGEPVGAKVPVLPGEDRPKGVDRNGLIA